MSKKTGTQCSRYRTSRFIRQCLAIVLTVAMVVTMSPIIPGTNMNAFAADELSGNTVQPIVVVSGEGVLGGTAYSASNVSNERSYTLDELKELADETEYLYSSLNSVGVKRIYKAKGLEVSSLFQETAFLQDFYDDYAVKFTASDGVEATFDPGHEGNTTGGSMAGTYPVSQGIGVDRVYFPNIATGDVSDAVPVPIILSWENKYATAPDVPDTLQQDSAAPRLIVGQLAIDDVNNPMFNQNVRKIEAGNAISETAITIDGVEKTRAEILMMARADRSYTYDTQGGSETVYARGVPLSILLSGYDDNDTVQFTTADNYPVSASGMTVAELIEGNYMLAYEVGESESELKGIYATAKNKPEIYGFFTLYGDGEKPAGLINSITVISFSGIDFVNSPYKHINNGGYTGSAPYGIDAITGATLTIEGPGLTSSVPLPIRELEEQNAGAYRGVYTDVRNGQEWTLNYEGIKLSHILYNMTSGDNGIHLTDKAYKVLIKNRVRQTIAEFTLDEIEEADSAGKPIIIAYGTGTEDGETVAPFVFDLGAGLLDELDNDDGPIKLVYDKSVFGGADPNPEYTEFGNLAYIYVAQQETPGYKHDKPPYDTPENSQYVLTVTGDKIGREVNYTVEQLEDMVQYGDDRAPIPGGMGYRAEYSLANSTYWYVNEYEGVQLWKLLLKSGLPAGAAIGEDKDTYVSFTATDNYKDFDKFTIEQVSNPDLFKYYEKNPADPNDGSYLGDDELDLRGIGYPVLVAYGVNGYPYVIKNTLDGYLSGLSNDGGPLRIISGKLEYSHANGSRQAKLLDKIIVGEDLFYSTHKYNPNKEGIYQQLAENSAVNVRVVTGSGENVTVLKEATYKVGDIEELIYGGSLTAAQLKDAKIKGFYELKKGSNTFNDLYEGINLRYFLEHVVQLPGYKGTITFSSGSEQLAMSLEEVLAYTGYNDATKLSNLSPVIAYAKNGVPLVADKNATGYESTVKLAEGTEYAHEITVKNDGGPLQVIFPRSTSDPDNIASLNSVTSIEINLTPDNYAHINPPYSSLADNTITVSGEGTRLTASKTFTVADLEGKQTLAVTSDYNIKKNSEDQSQLRFRGIPLYAFLSSTDVGLKPNADDVIVTCEDGTSYTFKLSEVYKSDYINGKTPEINNLRMILAYGSASVDNPDPEDGKPLVVRDTDEGYDANYGNDGGPIKLVVGQIDAEDANASKVLKNVVSIEVTASELTSWGHNTSAVYQQYLDEPFTLQVVDNNNEILFDRTYTVGQLEAMESLVERENITWVGTQEWEGINLWNFVIQETGTIAGVNDPISVTIYAGDGYTKELRSTFSMDALINGIKDGELRVPIIIGYAVKGYPLVPGVGDDGFVSFADNKGGPLRLMTHGNQGACVADIIKLVVKVGESGEDPQLPEEKDFNIYGLESGLVAMDIKAIKNITTGNGKTETEYRASGVTEKVKGAYLTDLLEAAGVTGSAVTVDIITTDGFLPDHYKGITLADLEAQAYFVAYDVSTDSGTTWSKIEDTDDNGVVSTVRIYRNYNGGDNWNNKVTCVKGITVTGAETGGEDPGEEPAVIETFTISGLEGGDIQYYVGGTNPHTIKGLPNNAGKVESSYPYNGETHYVKGALLSSILEDAGAGQNIKVTIITSDGYTKASYEDIPYSDIVDDEYFIAYDVGEGTQTLSFIEDVDGNGVTASFRIYRNYDDGSDGKKDNRIKGVIGIEIAKEVLVLNTYPANGQPGNLPFAGVRSVQKDKDGGLWVSTYGSGVGYKAASSESFIVYNEASNPALKTGSVFALAVDEQGGVWMSQGKEPEESFGVAYMKDGVITYYSTSDDPATIPHDFVQEVQIDTDGCIWFGSAAGATRYDPAAGTWTTWDRTYEDADGDSFPATSVDNIILDGRGGAWLGFYPDGIGTEDDPFVGGFAHITADGDITPYEYTSEYDAESGSSQMLDVWVRDIAIDKDGGVWAVASGSNGGNVWYVDAEGNVTQFTGYGLLGQGNFSATSKLRMVTFDPDGGLWFGTAGDGVFYVADPSTEAPFTVTAKYNHTTGSLPSVSWCNIYSLDFIGNTLYAGSSAGLAYYIFDSDNSGEDPGTGGETPVDYDLSIEGAVTRNVKLTLEQLQDSPSVVTKTYPSLNSYGTRGEDTFEGIYLEDLFKEFAILKNNAKSISIIGEDGYQRNFNLDEKPLGVYWTDLTGNKIMLAWKRNGTAIDLQLVIGQINEQHVNKPMWVSDVVSITVNATSTDSGSGTPGHYEGSQPGQDGEQETPAGGSPLTQEVKTQLKPETRVSGQTASTSVTTGEFNSALDQIKNNMSQQTGTSAEALKGVVEIDATSGSSERINKTEVSLTMSSIRAMEEATNVSAAIQTDLGTLTLDPSILAQLAQMSGGNLSISLEIADESLLSEEERSLAGGRPIMDIRLLIDGKPVTNFGGRTILAGIPYKAADTEEGSNLIVMYMDGSDKGKPVKMSLYNEESDEMLLRTGHLSLYGIGYREVAFSDTNSHWAKESIEFLAARDILKGKGANRFDPDGSVTRAEFVTMLANFMDGIFTPGAKSAGFDDVAAGAWYADYVNWAVQNRIVSGYGDGRFGPNDKITREQMAVMTDNFIKFIAMTPDVVKTKVEFSDQSQISSWSAAAVARVQQYGIINGNPNGTFAPKATATRAQAAVILKGYLEGLLK